MLWDRLAEGTAYPNPPSLCSCPQSFSHPHAHFFTAAFCIQKRRNEPTGERALLRAEASPFLLFVEFINSAFSKLEVLQLTQRLPPHSSEGAALLATGSSKHLATQGGAGAARGCHGGTSPVSWVPGGADGGAEGCPGREAIEIFPVPNVEPQEHEPCPCPAQKATGSCTSSGSQFTSR